MTVATGINLVLVLMCLIVVVQAIRMDRRIRALRDGQLDLAVEKLDNATHQARLVLAELKHVLSTDAAAQGDILNSARDLRDELSVIVGVGNTVAERIIEAADKARAVEAGVRGRSVRWREEADAVLRSVAEPQLPTSAPVSTAVPTPASASAEGAASAIDEPRNLSSIVFDLTSKRGNRVA